MSTLSILEMDAIHKAINKPDALYAELITANIGPYNNLAVGLHNMKALRTNLGAIWNCIYAQEYGLGVNIDTLCKIVKDLEHNQQDRPITGGRLKDDGDRDLRMKYYARFLDTLEDEKIVHLYAIRVFLYLVRNPLFEDYNLELALIAANKIIFEGRELDSKGEDVSGFLHLPKMYYQQEYKIWKMLNDYILNENPETLGILNTELTAEILHVCYF